ncbi:Protein SGT1-like protein [Larimichthys crocea]|uniref:Uncharacterized protein n=1 Tax=Larimichthys crocea TaxID=215358 RepID=A0ACD3QU81_LARCR|nr:Protein SGT1-like protein [Larimichthys crocea]
MGKQTQIVDDNKQTATVPQVKHDWYQTESQVIVTVMAKNVPKDGVCANFMDKELSATIQLVSGENHSLHLHLMHPIVPQQSNFKILSTKVEFKMKKTDAIRWEKLEGEGQESNIKHFDPNQYPSSSLHTCKWDKVVEDLTEEEKDEKLEGDAALNKLFQQIYCDGSDEVKRAMNKSFMESGGTVLSTNWKDVGKRKVEMNPPEDCRVQEVLSTSSLSLSLFLLCLTSSIFTFVQLNSSRSPHRSAVSVTIHFFLFPPKKKKSSVVLLLWFSH